MNKQAIEQNQISCDKCEGDGKNFAASSHEFFRRWRKNLEASQKKVALVLGVEVSQLSKFENGHLHFGESRQRKLAKILSDWNADGKKNEIKLV